MAVSERVLVLLNIIRETTTGYYYEIGDISTPFSGSQNVRVLGAELQVYLS